MLKIIKVRLTALTDSFNRSGLFFARKNLSAFENVFIFSLLTGFIKVVIEIIRFIRKFKLTGFYFVIFVSSYYQIMQSVVIEPSNYSPLVDFRSNGNLTLKGRSLMLDVLSFYTPLTEWISQYTGSQITFNIELDYFNTASAKKLLEMLKMIDENNNVQEFVVYWAFESDDEDILIKGQILRDRLKKVMFFFKELAGV